MQHFIQEQPVLDRIDAEIVQFWRGMVQMTAILDDLCNILEVYLLVSLDPEYQRKVERYLITLASGYYVGCITDVCWFSREYTERAITLHDILTENMATGCLSRRCHSIIQCLVVDKMIFA